MKIENKTHYETRDFKKLFAECIRRNDKAEGRAYRHKKNLRITISYSRYCYYSGNAYYGGPMQLRVPKNPRRYYDGKDGLDIPQVAFTFTHEFLHVRYYHHKEMAKNEMRFYAEEWEWAKEYEIRTKETKPKPKRDLRVERYKHAVEMAEKYERQMKRTERLLKKWRDKKAYYENDTELLRRMIQS